MKWSVDKTSGIAFGLTLLSLIAITGLSYFHALDFIDIIKQVYRAHSVYAALEQTKSSVFEMESSMRGFLLTHDERFYAPFDRAKRRINGYLYDLSEDISPEPEQRQGLEQLKRTVNERLALLVNLRRMGDKQQFASAVSEVISATGFAQSERINKLISQMEQKENEHLIASIKALDLVNQQSLTFSFFATLLASAVLVLSFIFVSRHLQLQHAREENERLQKEMLNAMLSTMGDGVLTVDTMGRFLIFNPAAQMILGKGPVEIGPEKLAQEYGLYSIDKSGLLPPGQLPTVRALRGESVDDLEMYVMNEARPGAYVSATARTLLDADGQPRAGVVVLRDVTQRKLAEQRLSEFYAILSHELRTPLTSIRGSLGLLEGGVAGDLSQMGRELVTIARVEVDRLIRLVNNILDMKKIEAGRLQLLLVEVKPVEIVELSLSNLRSLAQASDVSMVQDVRTDTTLTCDEDRIIQVLTNLVSNAIKFSPAGAAVDLVVSEKAGLVRFAVTDKGPGIAAEHIPLLFGKFQQLDTAFGKRKGTGLGLAISKALVEQHGGKIGVESVAGRGSTFWFELPVKWSGPGSASGGMPVVPL